MGKNEMERNGIMKKKILVFLFLVVTCVLAGCNQTIENTEEIVDDIDISKVKEIGTQIGKDEVYIASENINLSFYKNFTHLPSFTIDCLTSNEIETDNVSVNIDINTPYQTVVTEVDNEEFDLYSFALYTGYDWTKEEQLKEQDEEGYNEYQAKYMESYKKLEESDVGELHHYLITVTLDLSASRKTETFHSIEVKYNDQVFEKEIGKIEIDCDTENPKKQKSLYANNVALSDIYIGKNQEGLMSFSDTEMFQTENDVEIKNIYLMDQKDTIENCNVNISSQNQTFDMEWNGESIKIDGESNLGMELSLKREDFKDKTYYKCNNYLVIEYMEDGKLYNTNSELYFSTSLTSYQLYAYFFEGIEIKQ